MALVLLVDKDPHHRSMMAASLAEGGYAVRTAQNGWDALSSVDEECPDAVVAESFSHGLDGWSLAARLLMRAKPIPVVLMSSMGVIPPASGVRVLPRQAAASELCAAIAEAIA